MDKCENIKEINPIDNQTIFNERKMIYFLKAVAIFSVVCAHVHPGSVTKLPYIYIDALVRDIGSIGVGLFFIISGYLFYKNDRCFVVFIRHKIANLLPAWGFSGLIMALLYQLLQKKFNLLLLPYQVFFGWVGSYYLVCLFIFYFAFFFIKDNLIFMYCIIGISIISNLFTSFGMLSSWNPYMNPFNWAIYFSIGIIISKEKLLQKIACFSQKYFYALFFLYLVVLIVCLYNNWTISYWSYAFLPYEFISVIMLWGLATTLMGVKLKFDFITMLGKESFFIYLFNYPVATAVAHVFYKFNFWWAAIFMPLITIAILLLGLAFYKKCLGNLKNKHILFKIVGSGR